MGFAQPTIVSAMIAPVVRPVAIAVLLALHERAPLIYIILFCPVVKSAKILLTTRRIGVGGDESGVRAALWAQLGSKIVQIR